MKKQALLIIGLLLLGLGVKAQSAQNEWVGNRQTLWHKLHPITLAWSGMEQKGYYYFSFEDARPDAGVWGVTTQPGYVGISMTSGGNVGIGTNNPQAKFHIAAQTLLDADVNWGSKKAIYMNGPANYIRFNNSNGSNGLYFTNDMRTVMSVKGNDRVGIGTDSPEVPFDVHYQSRFMKNVNFEDTVGFKSTVSFDQPTVFHEKANFSAIGVGIDNPSAPLEVAGNAIINGNIIAKRISLDIGSFPDYVFEKEYKLMSLPDLAAFIKVNKHLPGVPSEDEMIKKGMDLKQMNIILMEKVEELTLHTIKQQELIEIQKNKEATQNDRITKLEQELERLSIALSQ